MSIEYIDNKHARLCVSIGSGANRKRYTKRITYQGKKDAQKQLKAFEDSLCTNYDSRLTVEKLVNMYIQEKITLGIKETTQHGYNACLKRLILAFGDTKANELSLLLVQDFINAESKIKGYKTIKNEVSLLNSSYKYGIQRGLVKENPCQYALLPKSSKKPVNILDKSVLSDFLQDVDNLYYGLKLTTYLALFCGLRKSEILALTIKDVNFDTKTITINKSRHRVDKKDVIQTTKTESSNRVLYVPDFILDIINKENEYLIVNEFGEPLNPNSVSKDFYERVGSKYNISLHGLRHTHTSILHDSGFSLAEISKQLGHSNINTTLSIYTHIFNNSSSKQIADTMSKMSPKCHQKQEKTAVSNGLMAEDMGLEPTV